MNKPERNKVTADQVVRMLKPSFVIKCLTVMENKERHFFYT